MRKSFHVCAVLAAAPDGWTAHAFPSCAGTTQQRAQVSDVVDASTIRLENGGTVRLIGALPPEPPRWWKGAKPWPPNEAARRKLEELVGDKAVMLRFAVSETQRDRHDRLLAQVFVLGAGEPIWVQSSVVGAGYAVAYSFPGNRACVRALQQKESAARDGRRGLWRKGTFGVLAAGDPAAISKRRGTYQLVEGRCTRSARRGTGRF